MLMTWEWIAGFFEGEGCISWYDGKKGTKQGTSGRINIGQKVKVPLQAIYDFLRQEGFEGHRLYLRPARRSESTLGKSCDVWMLALTRRGEVVKFLKMIEPMLFDKREKALMVISRLEELNRERMVHVDRAVELRKTGLSWHKIAVEMGIGYAKLRNHLVAAGIKVVPEQKPFEKNDWRKRRAASGLCYDCGKARTEVDPKCRCRSCQDKRNKRSRNRRLAERKGSPRIDFETVLIMRKR